MTHLQIDLAQIDLPALIERDGYPLRWQGREWHGACPFCGGAEKRSADRFRIQEKRSGGGWLYACRRCGKGGDAITYRRERHGESFADACAALGVALEAQRRAGPRKPARAAFVPIEPPAETWQDTAEAFALRCADALWTQAGARALTYLRGRGFADDTVRAFGIGVHLPPNNARGAAVGQWWAARGITLPRYYGGHIWQVSIRRSDETIAAEILAEGLDPHDADNRKNRRYKSLTGSHSSKALFNSDALITESRRAALHTVVVVGGEFDCMTAHQCAPAGMLAVTLGSEGATPDAECAYNLSGLDVLICLDSDTPGEAGAAKWLAAIPGARRIVSPVGKDLNDALRSGADLCAWLAGQVHYDRDVNGATINDMMARGYNVTVRDDGRLFAEPEGK
jgi:DNA primase